MFDSRLFWGSIVILIGLSIILNAVFKFNIPFFRIFIALVIIFFGFKMLFGSFGFRMNSGDGEHSTIFSSNKVHVEEVADDSEYNAVFGSQIIDLRDASISNNESDMEVNAVFGSVKMYLPENVTVRLKATSAFGSVRTSEGDQVTFGDTKRTFTKGADQGKTLHLEANAVFGSVEIR